MPTEDVDLTNCDCPGPFSPETQAMFTCATPSWCTLRIGRIVESMPRFMAQPELPPAKPLQLERDDANYSPVELAIRLGLGLCGETTTR